MTVTQINAFNNSDLSDELHNYNANVVAEKTAKDNYNTAKAALDQLIARKSAVEAELGNIGTGKGADGTTDMVQIIKTPLLLIKKYGNTDFWRCGIRFAIPMEDADDSAFYTKSLSFGNTNNRR